MTEGDGDPAVVRHLLAAAGIDQGTPGVVERAVELLPKVKAQHRTLSASPLAEPPGRRPATSVGVTPAAGDDAYVWRAPSQAAATGGPLGGLRVAVKDNISVEGAPTLAGTAATSFNAGDAEIVARLRAAGASIVGTTTLQELALGDVAAPTRNPHDRTRGCGGSSAGSAAAVAAASVDLALGTDTGGSVRLPAAMCGVVGFKPTAGSLPTVGVVPLAHTLDTVGLLAPDVATTARAWHALVGTDPAPARRWTDARVGVVPELVLALDPDVETAYRDAIRRVAAAGSTIVEIELGPIDDVLLASSIVIATEAAAAHGALVSAGAVSDGVARRLVAGALSTGTEYDRARRSLTRAATLFAEATSAVDVIVTPTAPTTAWPFEERVPGRVRNAWVRTTVPWNVAGAPAVSVPHPQPGLPVGIQLGGRRGADGELLAAAAMFEELLAA